MTTNKKIHTPKIFQKNINSSLLIDFILTILIFAIIGIIISNPTKYTTGTISGLKLFVFSVLPGLFPFMLLTKLITEIGFIFNISQKFDRFSNKVFGTPGISIYVFIMSIISGYPIGAKIIADLYQKGQITEQDAKKMSIFCTTSGPIFVIGSVGTIMFNSLKIGIILYLSHILSSVLLGIFYNLFNKNKSYQPTKIIIATKKSNIISVCIEQTINSLFIVGAYITIFYLIGEIFETLKVVSFFTNLTFPIFNKFGITKQQLTGLFYGILEVTRGSKTLSFSPNNISIVLTSGILSFSGFSIIMQSLSFLKIAKIKAHSFAISKCVHCVLSMILCFLFIICFN